MYVDDLVTGGESTSEVDKINDDSVNLFQSRGFKLHKWHSNEQALETNNSVNENELSNNLEQNQENKNTRVTMGQKGRFLHYSSTEC